MIILGDFNLPYVNWTSDSGNCDDYGFLPEIGDSESIEANLSRKITSELLNLGLYQMCNFKNRAGNELDLAYTNIPELTSVDKADLKLFPDNMSDLAHTAMTCVIECDPIKFKFLSQSKL